MPRASFKQYQTQKQFRCNHCGGEMQLFNKRTQYVGCSHCGSLADVREEANKVLLKTGEPSKYKPFSFVKVGSKGRLKGKEFKVIGRTRFSMDYLEYWKEDGEIGYEKTTWEYDEWLLMNEDGTYNYLIEDKEGFKASETVTPKYPSLPSGTTMYDFNSGKSQITSEYGKVRAAFFEGESTYQVQVDDEYDFWTFKAYPHSYTAEARYADQNKTDYIEISFYKETPIQKMEWVNVFGIDEDFQQFFKKKKGINTHRTVIRAMFAVAAVVFFVFWIKSFFGDVIFQQQIPLDKFTLVSQNDTFMVLQAKTDFFELKETDRVYGLSVLGEMPTNKDFGIEIEVLDDKGESVNLMSKELYCSSGVEGGESWTENDNEFLEHYFLDSAGKYQLDLTVEINQGEVLQPYSVKMTVDRTLLSRYFFICFLVFSTLAIFTNRPKSHLDVL